MYNAQEGSGGLPAAAACRKSRCRVDNGSSPLKVVKCRSQYRRNCDFSPAEFLSKEGGDIEAAARIEAEDVKAGSSNRAWPSIPKLNEHFGHADALSSEP